MDPDSDEVRAAYAFAREAHDGQVSEVNGEPYFEHVAAVAGLLAASGASADTVTAGVLHDAVERTRVKSGDLRSLFGTEVASLVEALTDPPDVSRFRPRKAALLDQVVEAGAKARLIFAADKIVNVKSLRRAIAEEGEERVRARLSVPLEAKIEHYQAALDRLENAPDPAPLVALLRHELVELGRQTGVVDEVGPPAPVPPM